MGYTPEQEAAFLHAYLTHTGAADDVGTWAGQIAIYRSLERVKSAIVDGIRYAGDVRQPGLSAAQRHDYARRYQRKLELAWRTWGIDPRDVGLTIEAIGTLLMTAPLSG